MITIRCKDCGVELTSQPTKTQCCGCPNMSTVKGMSISAVDLSRVIMLNSINNNQKKNVLSNEDLAFQESRRKRKVRRLDFEVR
jgi:hypothetical protein